MPKYVEIDHESTFDKNVVETHIFYQKDGDYIIELFLMGHFALKYFLNDQFN